jgi:Ca-activated chloride channel homolog
MKTLLLSFVTLAVLAAQAGAQQLIAWPIGQPGFRQWLPGQPVRPMPRPMPLPRPQNPPQTPPQHPIDLSAFGVTGTIDDQAATLTYKMTFRNPGSTRLEGVLLMPLPENAALNGFKMTVAGKEANAEVLDSKQATTIYEGIVARQRDPGLLELIGERTLRARVFPIEPNGTIDVTLTVSQLVPASGGLRELRIPLRSTQFTAGERVGSQAVRLTLNSLEALRTLYSPTAGAKIDRKGERGAEITYSPDGAAKEDFLLFYSAGAGPLSASAISYREKGEDGFVLVSLSPRAHAAPGVITPKDVVFIVDRSGSMNEGGKMEQAKRALSYCLGRLSPHDRFALVDFATDVQTFKGELMQATPENVAQGQRYIDRIEGAGGTNIQGGLSEGLKLLTRSEGRVPMAFFVTDGVPTVGQTQVDDLLREAAAKTGASNARLFAFGVGSDVNTLLLDKLAQGNGGARDYVAPGEDIEAKVSTLYQKVAKPALTDVKIEWKGVDVAQVYPRPIRDVFYGSELAVMGRYKEGGKGSLVVTGRVGGKPARFEFPLDLPEQDMHKTFVPRLWANMKVAHELDAVRLAGGNPDPEVVQSIVKLAKRYGIITPYTSALITEDSFGALDAHGNPMPAPAVAANEFNRARTHALESLKSSAAAARGSGFSRDKALSNLARRDSMMFSSISGAASNLGGGGAGNAALDGMAKAGAMAREEMRREGKKIVATKVVGAKTFYRRGSSWIDGDYELAGSPAPTKVKFLSSEYFELLREHPELKSALALGSAVTVYVEGKAYSIED